MDVQLETNDGRREIASRAALSLEPTQDASALVRTMKTCRYSKFMVLMPSDISLS